MPPKAQGGSTSSRKKGGGDDSGGGFGGGRGGNRGAQARDRDFDWAEVDNAVFPEQMESLKPMIMQATKKTPQREKTPKELEREKKLREEEDKEEEELEKQCEQWCGKICRVGILVPILFSYLVQPVAEFAMRPPMVVDTSLDLSGTNAIVTGGCSGVGMETAKLLAEAGASVVLGCRDIKSAEAGLALKAVKTAQGRWSKRNGDYAVKPPTALHLDLDTLSSVRSFAQRYVAEVGALHLLVNNAGTRKACNLTEDGMEVAFQANYLGHFLLTNLLLPTLKRSSPSRVIHVTCRDGYVRQAHGWSRWFKDGWLKGWLGLPTPISEGLRVGSAFVEPANENPGDDEDKTGHAVVDDGDEDGQRGDESDWSGRPVEWTGGCKPEKAYANAKMAVLAFSHELERRLRNSVGSEGVVSHSVNPNAVMTEFVAKGTPPSPQQQSVYYTAMSYFPPTWIARKVFGWLHTKMNSGMMRSAEHGAKGVFHVAVSKALAGAGGGLFDDMESAFHDCGRAAHLCGRVPRSWQPPMVLDRKAAGQLWSLSEGLVTKYAMPLKGDRGD